MQMVPPSTEAVVRGAPLAFLALAVPIAGLAVQSLNEKAGKDEAKEQADEAERCANIVRDMVSSLEKAEAFRRKEAEQQKIVASNPESAPSAADETEPKAVATAEVSDARGAGEADDDLDDSEIDQIEFDTLSMKCEELAGVTWCAKLLLRELQTATRKTEQQKDTVYSDGEKLERLLDCPLALDSLAKITGNRVPHDLRTEIREAYRKAYNVRRTQNRRGVVKALKMLCLAKETLHWVLFSNVTSTFATTLSTVALHYRAEVLQSLRVSGKSRRPFYRATCAMMVVEFAGALARTLETQVRTRVSKVMATSIQVRLFMALMSKDMSWWSQQRNPWENISMVMSLPMQIENALETPRTFIDAFTRIFIQASLVRSKSSRMLYAMITLHWVRFALRKGLHFLENLLQAWATRSLVMPSRDKFTWIYAINPEYIQMFQSFSRGPREAKDLVSYMRTRNRTNELSSAVEAVVAPARSAIEQAGNIAEYLSMGSLVENGNVDVTEAETMMHYATEVGNEVQSTYSTISFAGQRFVPLAKAYDMISMPLKIDPAVGFNPGQRAAGHFVFEDVRFRYPGKKGDVLKGVNFEVKTGQVVGITGASGCGKSTCLRLLERFYDVTGGRILLDGRDIREYEPRWLRAQTVVVSQEPKLLPTTIRDNLIFGCERRPTMQEIEQACRSANIWDLLMDPQKFPNGLETQMSVVQNVAGGEKQRICIARAILADSPILLLDEATSSLDEASQAYVQEALNKLMKGRTTLVVAHRLSTIKDSDKIIGLDGGCVVDDGTHRELLRKPNGVWRKLWELQAAHGMHPPDQGNCSSKPLHQASASAECKSRVAEGKINGAESINKYELLRQTLQVMLTRDDVSEQEQDAQEMLALIDDLESQAASPRPKVGVGASASADSTPSKSGSVRSNRRINGALRSAQASGTTVAPRAAAVASIVKKFTLEHQPCGEQGSDAATAAVPSSQAVPQRV